MPSFYLFNEPTPLQGNSGKDPLLRVQTFYETFFESFRETFHLSDFINDDQAGRRVEKLCKNQRDEDP